MTKPSLTAGFDLPFQEQIDFFRAKLNLPTEKWDDIWQDAHDRAFVVAGATKADLLNDLRQAVDKAISTGTSLETFRKDFRAIVAKNGWQGWTGEGTPGGFAWRTKVIYETNLRTSYAAGRWAQLTDPAFRQLMPFWRYVHADSVVNPRPLHKRWGDMRLTLPSDHPFWKTHFPPNGWGCRCRVTATTKAKDGDATAPPEGWDRINETTGAPPGIDRGWGYAPGASTRGELKNVIETKAKALPPTLGKALIDSTAKVLNRIPFEVAKSAKEAAAFAMRADLADFADYGSIKPEVANAWNRSLYDHLTEFPELRKNQRFVGTAQAQFSRWREIEIGRYIAKLKAANPHLPDDYNYRPMAEKRIKPIRVAGNTYAHSWAQADVAGVAVNQKFGKDTDAWLRSLAADVKSKFHPPGCDTIRSVVDHELAHQLDGLLKIHLDADAIRIYNEARSKGLKNEVSVYAGSNIREFIAECWAESCNNPTPREFARRIAALIRQRYADQFP